MPDDDSPTPRTVTSKVMGILAVFETGPAHRTLSDIAAEANLPLSTAHRLVGELVAWGALKRDPTGNYRVGLRLWKVAQNAGRQLRDAARPYLTDLFALCGETSHLAIRDGSEVVYVDRIYGSTKVPKASRVGGRLPLHATAVGKVLLAFDEPWVAEAYLTRRLAASTAYTHVDPRRLAEELRQVREQGYATAVEEVRLGSCSIAVPVMFNEERAAAAVGLVLMSNEADRMTRHLPALRGTAKRLEPTVRRSPMSSMLVTRPATDSD